MTTLTDDLPDLLAGLVTSEWIDAQVFAPTRWHIPGIFPEGFGLLVGPPKAGKSWLTLEFSLALATGGQALGILPVGDPRPVLLLALEDGHRRLQDRMRQLRTTPGTANLHILTSITPGNLLDTIRQWAARHAPNGDGVVILDTLGKVAPPPLPGEGAFARDYRIGGELKRVADDCGLAVIAVHHDRKAGADDFVETVSGTNGLTGSADTIVVLARSRHSQDGVLKVTGRDVQEAEYAVTLDGVQWRLAGADLAEAEQAAEARREEQAVAGFGDTMQQAVAAVNRHPEGITPAKVAAEIGASSDTVRQNLKRAADNGLIAKRGYGTYTPVTPVTPVTPALLNHPFVTGGRDESKSDNRDRCDTGTGEPRDARGDRSAWVGLQPSRAIPPDGTCTGCRLPLISVNGSTRHPGC
jgi:DNA-binding Lrp family transcriptional regulator